jgi:D-alanine-D-alanine ligase
VLYGAVAADAGADEQDTLIEVNAVSATLAALDYRAEPIEMTLDLARVRQRLEYLKPEFVFNLVTSIAGDDRCQHLAPTLLDSMHLAYTGAPLTAMLATANKLDVKQRLRAHGLPTPDWRTAAELPTRENGIWIVKSAWLHASVGLDDGAVVPGTKLRDVLNRADSTWFAERYIDGREINVALLEDGRGAPEVLPTAEIEFYDFPAGKPRIVGYAAKWNPESFEYRHTRRRFLNDSEAALIEELKRLARACWTRFGLRGYARIDFRIDAEGRPWILEINTNPCLSPDAGFAAAAAKADLDSQALIARIVQAACVPSSSATTQSDSCSAYAASTT